MFFGGKELPPSEVEKIAKKQCNLNLLRESRTELVHNCSVRVHFDDLEAHLISYIDMSACIVGCVAWITNTTILSQLSKKRVNIIIDASYNYIKEYDSLIPITGLSAVPPAISAISCLGITPDRKSQVTPFMHHKFLVFMDSQLKPYAVWTGSFNLTNNASRSLENATLLCGEGVAKEYYDEWAKLIKFAKPLTTKPVTVDLTSLVA